MFVVLFSFHDGTNTKTELDVWRKVPTWTQFVRPTPQDHKEVHTRSIHQSTGKRVVFITREYSAGERVLYAVIGPVTNRVAQLYLRSVNELKQPKPRGVYSKYRALVDCHADFCERKIVNPQQVYLAVATPAKVFYAPFTERYTPMAAAASSSAAVAAAPMDESLSDMVQSLADQYKSTISAQVAKQSEFLSRDVCKALDEKERSEASSDLRAELSKQRVLHRLVALDIGAQDATLGRVVGTDKHGERPDRQVLDRDSESFFEKSQSLFDNLADTVATKYDLEKPTREAKKFIGESLPHAWKYTTLCDGETSVRDSLVTWTIPLFAVDLVADKYAVKGSGTVTIKCDFTLDGTFSVVWNLQTESKKCTVVGVHEDLEEVLKKAPTPAGQVREFIKACDFTVNKIREEVYKKHDKDPCIYWNQMMLALRYVNNLGPEILTTRNPLRLVVCWALLHMASGVVGTDPNNLEDEIDAGTTRSRAFRNVYKNFQVLDASGRSDIDLAKSIGADLTVPLTDKQRRDANKKLDHEEKDGEYNPDADGDESDVSTIGSSDDDKSDEESESEAGSSGADEVDVVDSDAEREQFKRPKLVDDEAGVSKNKSKKRKHEKEHKKKDKKKSKKKDKKDKKHKHKKQKREKETNGHSEKKKDEAEPIVIDE